LEKTDFLLSQQLWRRIHEAYQQHLKAKQEDGKREPVHLPLAEEERWLAEQVHPGKVQRAALPILPMVYLYS